MRSVGQAGQEMMFFIVKSCFARLRAFDLNISHFTAAYAFVR